MGTILRDKLFVTGRCRSCGRYLFSEAGAVIDLSGLPSTCECGSDDISWLMEHRHMHRRERRWQRMKGGLMLILVVVALLLLCGAAIICHKVNRTFTAEEMAIACAEANALDTQEILSELYSAGVDDRKMGRLFGGISPWVFWRLRTGQTQAQPSLSSSINGIYCAYLLLDKRWYFVQLKNLMSGGRIVDIWYSFPSPLEKMPG